MIKILKELKNNKKLCSIYSDGNDTGAFSVGVIVDLDDDFFLVGCVNPNGFNDGLFCRLIDRIIKIETSGQYNDNLEKLFNYHNQKRCKSLNCDNDVVITLLNYALKNKKICSIELLESDYEDAIGFVEEISDEIVKIQQINQNGNKDCIILVKLGRISNISCDSEDTRKLEILNKLNS